MLTLDRALALAGRHQRAPLRQATAYATALGERVGYLCRSGPKGTEFEAVALGSARTFAVVDVEGRVRYVAGAPPRDPWQRVAGGGTAHARRTGGRRIAEQTLAASARPR